MIQEESALQPRLFNGLDPINVVVVTLLDTREWFGIGIVGTG